MYMKKHGLHLSKEEFLIKYKNFDDMYEITSPWTNSQEKHIIRCKKCNHKWCVRPYNVAIGSCGCPFCTDHHTKWDTLFVSQLLEDNEFELLSECNCKNDDVLVRHKKCGTVFYNKPKNFTRKCEGLWLISCPNCRNNSHGEYVINEILTAINVLNPIISQSKEIYKEKQFLAGLTISEVLSLKDGAAGQSFGDEVRIDESADDEIIFQGAFDLLAIGDQQAHIIDYKYSTKDEQYLREHYALQLALYKKVVAKVLKIPMQNVRCTMVNIARGFQVEMP